MVDPEPEVKPATKPALVVRLGRPSSRRPGRPGTVARRKDPAVSVRVPPSARYARTTSGALETDPVRKHAKVTPASVTRPPVVKPRWNVLAILAIPMAVLFAPAGFFAGRAAAKQIRESGERGALLAALGWILGASIFVAAVTAMTVETFAYAIQYGLSQGMRMAAGEIVTVLLEWFFGPKS